ncbi:hypothetical protein HPP92_016345 [Vanilla planifolia]|uniref:Late embryogenesis abundant protein LEA-2 subgroup domain-containing protein n=1 Tax=Vanilla planifolia TaxID=51239 RepID=A0A835UR63_VANPL|nr:hypothetical protein HPP92_016345 [Vanilla planifolia]
MEEGEHPSSRPPLPRPPASASSAIVSTSPLTYVVQIPKNQIYRIPPPENAHLAEHYRTHVASLRHQRAPCLKFLSRFFLIFAAVAVPLLIAALVLYLLVRPASPTLRVHHLAAKKTQFDVSASIANPSNAMGYLLDGGGAAVLAYQGKSVAKGEPPHFYLKAKESKTFRLEMHGVGKAADRERLRGSKETVELRLTVDVPVRLGVWGLRLWEMKMNMDCEIMMKSLGKKARVASQDCKTKVMITLC